MTDNSLNPLVLIPAKKAKSARTNWTQCIFCQKSDNLSAGTERGINRVTEVVTGTERRTDELVARLEDDIDSLGSHCVKWHRSCYASFTSKHNISRIPSGANSETLTPIPRPITRTVTIGTDWKFCIFCQTKKREPLHLVQSKEVSGTIHKLAEAYKDVKLKSRIGDLDLVAYGARYHQKCRLAAQYECTKTPVKTGSVTDSSFENLCTILDRGLREGCVYDMSSITLQYASLTGAKDGESVHSNVLKRRLEKRFGDRIMFRRQRNQQEPLLLFPTVTTGEVIEALTSGINDFGDATQSSSTEVNHDSKCPTLLQAMHHVASQINSDLQNTPGHGGYDNLTPDSAMKCVPESLYLLLKWIISGPGDPTEMPSTDPSSDSDCTSDYIHKAVVNIGQDILYSTSNGKKNTPKHIGTGIVVHHATRSRKLIDYLHAVGDSVSYNTVQRIDTSIGEDQIQKFVDNGNVFIPENVSPGRFVQFAGDNFDINEDTLDGKGTFHVTQMCMFQVGPQDDIKRPKNTAISKSTKLNVPEEFNQMSTVYMPTNHIEPEFLAPVTPDQVCGNFGYSKYHRRDVTWALSRQTDIGDQCVPGWTGFNQATVMQESVEHVTSVGYLPIIPAPAHELDTVMTTLIRCNDIAKKLGQGVTVVTFDQNLYCRARELVWLKPTILQNTVIRLGSFHIAMNYLSAIGKHMADSGLLDAWVQSGLFSVVTATSIMRAKSWNKAIRAHKVTFEALMRLMLRKFESWQEEEGINSYHTAKESAVFVAHSFMESSESTLKHSLCCFTDECVSSLEEDLKSFCDANEWNQTFRFWKTYTDMVSIMLRFVRADREGDWPAHIRLFQQMLPLMAVYDHTNYLRWGVVYLSDMQGLADTHPDVHRQFMDGHFTVKETSGKFNSLPTDQALEHINKLCKVSGGLVGITRNQSALDRWMVTCGTKSRLSNDVFQMVGYKTPYQQSHKDMSKHQMKKDESDVKSLVATLQDFNPYGRDTPDLICISTNDVVPSDITEDLISVMQRGSTIVEEFVHERLDSDPTKKFHDPIKKTNSNTFANVRTPQQKNVPQKAKIAMADRDLYRRLLVATTSGRRVDLADILTHELAGVPLSLATHDHQLRSSDAKSDLGHELTDDVVTAEIPQTDDPTAVIIDGMALVHATKPPKDGTFGDYAATFTSRVLGCCTNTTTRVDVVFDVYQEKSIKKGKRLQRSNKTRPIRRIINHPDVALPLNWSSFLAMDANKTNLVQFLTSQLMQCAEDEDRIEVIVAGGQANPEHVVSSKRPDMTHLFSSQEEADTRLILHAQDASLQYQRVIIESRDTDVLIMLLYHPIDAELWMKAGTRKNPRNLPIHLVEISDSKRENLLALHAISGCDTTSHIYGFSKKSHLKLYNNHHQLLSGLMTGSFSGPEQYIIKLYDQKSKAVDVNQLRTMMFSRTNEPERLPPTRDALMQHLKRCQYQVLIWHNATVSYHDTEAFPSPETQGWQLIGDELEPILMTLNPVPQQCRAILSCGCASNVCTSNRCTCVKNKLPCSTSCKCQQSCRNPKNSNTDEQSDESDLDTDE